ncbi:serpin family protein [Cellulomonas persica]|nr:serpin family protein [Cellulomonas persica]
MQAAQQAVLRVDEAGTRAAAVTEVMAGEAAPVATREVRFDRPFLLVVRDVTTGWPLFLASVADPTL